MSMRVKELSNIPRTTLGPSPAEEKRDMGGSGQNFQRHMSDVNSAEYERYLSDLSDRIQQQGELVGQKMDLAEYQKYRELIMELLNETASNSYMFFKQEKFDARGRHKILAVIRKVNSKLDELAATILEEQKDNIQTLAIMDDIRGMLVDILM
ncbi:YaaR family protein [Eubacteriales bacterium OttesenSCG-928-M02]|nr:YaaR family protein [Eubacteriales bacterium OttesenSCG-928-M02]